MHVYELRGFHFLIIVARVLFLEFIFLFISQSAYAHAELIKYYFVCVATKQQPKYIIIILIFTHFIFSEISLGDYIYLQVVAWEVFTNNKKPRY